MALRDSRWLDRRVVRSVTVRQLALGLAIALVAVAARWRWDQLVAAQTPYIALDTKLYQQIAQRPLDPALVFDAKPLVVPLVFRAAGNAPAVIVRVQAELAFAAWAILTAVLAWVVQRRSTRVAAIAVGLAFLLAPVRVGFTGSLLPESINDGGMALVIAGALALLRLRGGPRIAVAIATGLVGVAWLLTRDTNAFAVAAGTGVALAVWRGGRSRTAWALAALVAVACGLVLWTTTVGRDPLPCQAGWDPRFMPRGAYPLVHNVLWRVYPDQHDALPAGLAAFATSRSEDIERFIRVDPANRPLQDWVLEHGAASYARWLVRHPIDRVGELIAARWQLFAQHLEGYMAVGWDPGAGSLRAAIANRWLLIVLLLASPWLLWRPRADPRRGVALCVVLGGVVGIVASYYGDAAELRRHCYGSGQQLLLGLAIGALVAIDRWPRRRASTG